ncbi:MAG: hypothetical protein WA629_03580 [Candidatus Aquilonibacter sp.]
MTPTPFSDAFCEFVRNNIFSVEQILVLELLSQQPQRGWFADELCARLSTSSASIMNRLSMLERRGLIGGSERDGFRYRPDPARDPLVEELHRQFLERPVSVIALIFSGPSALESFSDAFRIGGDDDTR